MFILSSSSDLEPAVINTEKTYTTHRPQADHFDSLIANETFYIHELATFLELLAPHVGTFIQRSFHSGCSGLLDFHRFWLTVLTRTKSQFVLCESKTAFHKLLAEAFTKYSDFFRIYATFVKQVHLFYDSIQV